MATTALHPNGVSGVPHAFSAKTEASPSKGVGIFTQLHANGVMGVPQTFSAKGVAPTGGPFPHFIRRSQSQTGGTIGMGL